MNITEKYTNQLIDNLPDDKNILKNEYILRLLFNIKNRFWWDKEKNNYNNKNQDNNKLNENYFLEENNEDEDIPNIDDNNKNE